MKPPHILIIGGGYAGTLQAINLLRSSQACVTLIERSNRLARGLAYGACHPDHLLNVRASQMSAFADAPDDFAHWLQRNGQGDGVCFARRQIYGRYLEELLDLARAAAGERLRIMTGEVISIARVGEQECATLASGERVEADSVILAIGNLPPGTPRALADLDPDICTADPWNVDITAGLSEKDNVLLLGTGLTAIDAAMTLDAAGFMGRITALSRRGLIPRAQLRQPHEPHMLATQPEAKIGHLIRLVRQDSERIGWRAAIDQLRPHTQSLWMSATPAERERFLRHLRPYWDVHRHRVAPEIAARIAELKVQNRLSFTAGKILSATPEGKGARVLWRPRGSDEEHHMDVRRIINCTGPQDDINRAAEPLLAHLLRGARIAPGPCRIGIGIDEHCRVLDGTGQPSGSLYAIGPMTRGSLWEIIAVPDIRVQTAKLAKQLS